MDVADGMKARGGAKNVVALLQKSCGGLGVCLLGKRDRQRTVTVRLSINLFMRPPEARTSIVVPLRNRIFTVELLVNLLSH